MSKSEVKISSSHLVLHVYLRYGEQLRSLDIKIIFGGKYLTNVECSIPKKLIHLRTRNPNYLIKEY